MGHTQLQKELDHLTLSQSPDGVTLTGSPHYKLTPGTGEERIQSIAITADLSNGQIRDLLITEIDGSTTAFQFSGQQENVPASDADFRFQPPAGVSVVDGLPPS